MLCLRLFLRFCNSNRQLIDTICLFISDMMPWMMPILRYNDDSLKSSFQESLSLMRKNRLFCDVILHVSKINFCHLTSCVEKIRRDAVFSIKFELGDVHQRRLQFEESEDISRYFKCVIF